MDEMERMQNRAVRFIFPNLRYPESLGVVGRRRKKLCEKLFSQIEEPNHKLADLLQFSTCGTLRPIDSVKNRLIFRQCSIINCTTF